MYNFIFKWNLVSCGYKNGQPTRHVCERERTICSKYAKHSKFNSQHNWGDPYDYLNEHMNLHFDNE